MAERSIRPKIQEYGVIGDCRAAALVSKYGSIDWLCWPRFDSPSIFAAILDPTKDGYWCVRPTQPFQVQRAYIRDSNVLETHFMCSSGRATLTDMMPVCSEEHKHGAFLPDHELLRELRCSKGNVEVAVEFCPRADYGCRSIAIRSIGALGLRMDVGRGAYWLRSTVPLRVNTDSALATFSLQEGEFAQFSLIYAEESPTVLRKR